MNTKKQEMSETISTIVYAYETEVIFHKRIPFCVFANMASKMGAQSRVVLTIH